jgi:hypothetical protein
VADVTERLRVELTAAMRRRDAPAVSAMRSALAAISNAEAVPGDVAERATMPVTSPHVAGAASGAGVAEVPRRRLDASLVAAIVRAEAESLDGDARHAQAAGQPSRAERLRAEAAALRAVLDGR